MNEEIKPKEKKKNGNSTSNSNDISVPGKVTRIKGWFPRQCASEMFDQFYDDQEFENDSIQDKDTKKSN